MVSVLYCSAIVSKKGHIRQDLYEFTDNKSIDLNHVVVVFIRRSQFKTGISVTKIFYNSHS